MVITRPSNYFFCSALLLLWLGLGGGLSFARVVSVGVANGGALSFFPATTNIAVNDQVIWTWNTTGFPPHSSTSDTNGIWDSGLFQGPHSFTNTFATAGTYPYHCTQHISFGMRGTITVSGPSQPPQIAITNPAAGAVFATPANVTIQAAVTNGSSAVTNVQFLVGSSVLTNETTAPFSATTNNLAAGSYTLSAIATDNNGLKATNTATISVVTPVPVVIGSPLRPSRTNFQFSYTANVGLGYIVQRSTNLLSTNWITLVTNTAAASPANFFDTNATASPGFYRVGRLRNP